MSNAAAHSEFGRQVEIIAAYVLPHGHDGLHHDPSGANWIARSGGPVSG